MILPSNGALFVYTSNVGEMIIPMILPYNVGEIIIPMIPLKMVCVLQYHAHRQFHIANRYK